MANCFVKRSEKDSRVSASAAYQRLYRQARIAAGLCVECGHPAQNDRTRCRECGKDASDRTLKSLANKYGVQRARQMC